MKGSTRTSGLAFPVEGIGYFERSGVDFQDRVKRRAALIKRLDAFVR